MEETAPFHQIAIKQLVIFASNCILQKLFATSQVHNAF